MHPSSASADFTGTAILRLCFGRAVFCLPDAYLAGLGGTTAQVCRLPRRGETDARFKSLLKHRVGGGAAPAMHPSSASATATTAASGGNREELLGLRPAGYEARSRAEIDAGNRNPGKTARRCGFSRAVMSVKVNFFPDGLTFLLFGI